MPADASVGTFIGLEQWPWVALALAGAFHGINPAMGWLFAVALGLQERRLGAVLGALGPIALGHVLSIIIVVGLLLAARTVVPLEWLRWGSGAALILFGLFKLLRPRSHPKWVGMRVTPAELTLWSFLMSSAHGAGLMLLPLILGATDANAAAGHADHTGHAAAGPAAGGAISAADLLTNLAAVSVHSAAMLLVMALVAVIVYTRVGVMILRSAWINLDVVWAAALILAGLLTFVL